MDGWSCGECLDGRLGIWKGGVQASWVEEFGLSWWSEELGILKWRELGSVVEFQVFWVEFGLVLVVEEWRLGAGGGKLIFSEEEEANSAGSHALSGSLSIGKR